MAEKISQKKINLLIIKILTNKTVKNCQKKFHEKYVKKLSEQNGQKKFITRNG